MLSTGKLIVYEMFFENSKRYSRAQDGSLRLSAGSAERFEKPLNAREEETKQLSIAYASFALRGVE